MRTRICLSKLPALPVTLGLATLGLVAWAPAGVAQQPRPGMVESARTQAQQREDADRDAKNDQKSEQKGATDGDKGGDFSVQPETMNFGKTPLFLKRVETFVVRNHGQAAIRNLKVELTGYNENLFTLDNGCGASLSPGQQCEIKVAFDPTSDGDKSAEVRVTAGDNFVRTRKVVGSGVAAKYTATPKSLTFGKVERNKASKEQVVTITNTGPVNLPITATSLSGPNEHQFSQSNDCPRELEIGKSCKSTVTFRPTFQGQHTATLTVWAKGGAPETKIELQGTGS